MPRFSEVEARKPNGFVLVPPSAFAAEWRERPEDTIAVGLRLIPHRDLQGARAMARRRANEAIPKVDVDDLRDMTLWADAYHDALLEHIVACGTCDPNDAMEPWPLFKAAPEDMVRQYVTSDGLRLVFDAWERMRIATDPTQREAADAEVAALPDLLAERAEALGKVRTMRARRLLAYVLDELKSVSGASQAPALGHSEDV